MIEDDAERFLEASDGLAGLSKRDLSTEIFRLKIDLSARYGYEVEGFEDDYEAILRHESADAEAEFVVDRRGDETEINAFVVVDGDVVVNEVRRL